jgi:uncharacterized protein YutE (UPF0331/DUF86 family)
MDRDIISRKLDSLARCVRRIETKRPATVEELVADIDLQDILSVNLERAIQICVDIGAHVLADLDAPPPATMGEVFASLAAQSLIPEGVGTALRKAVGFRNLSVHSYDQVDWQRVFEIVHHRLDDFRRFSRHINDWADQNP